MFSKSSHLPSYRNREAEVDSEEWLSSSVTNHNLTSAAVVIIGGGISGICTAIDLLVNRQVRNFVILEKSGGFGGTW
jgi:heterodisulfide reductase subunit A-like polyferredoxin